VPDRRRIDLGARNGFLMAIEPSFVGGMSLKARRSPPIAVRVPPPPLRPS